jgi:hypothetical protein
VAFSNNSLNEEDGEFIPKKVTKRLSIFPDKSKKFMQQDGNNINDLLHKIYIKDLIKKNE